MQFPNEVQAAVLLEQPIDHLEDIVRQFRQLLEAQTGQRFNVPEANPGLFYRMFGGDSVMITFELIRNPGNPDVFQQALGSPVIGLLCPDVRQRIMMHQAMVLVNVSHGVMGSVMDDPQFANLFAEIGMPREGANLPQFRERLDMCALAARFVCDNSQPTLVHWTQSNQLLIPELFDEAAKSAAPGMLHVHPWLFGPPPAAGQEAKAGIRTFGMRHFIGREVVIEPSILPWAANYDTVLAFLKMSTMDKGYVIPDGDTFGDEGRTLSYRVRHLEAAEGDVPLYELTPLFHKEHDFVAEDFAPFENVIDDRAPPQQLMPQDDGDAMELANDWREKRKLAESAGNQFEVRSFQAPPPRAAPPSDGSQTVSGMGIRRKVFGRKGAR